MSDWYDKYIADIAKQAANVKPVEDVGQNILRMKSVGSKAFEGFGDGKCFTFDAGNKHHSHPNAFGFSEQMVNQLMRYAYDQGAKEMSKRSYAKGYDAARAEFLKAVDALEPFDEG